MKYDISEIRDQGVLAGVKRLIPFCIEELCVHQVFYPPTVVDQGLGCAQSGKHARYRLEAKSRDGGFHFVGLNGRPGRDLRLNADALSRTMFCFSNSKRQQQT